jgi:hypothetical protein
MGFKRLIRITQVGINKFPESIASACVFGQVQEMLFFVMFRHCADFFDPVV